MNKLMLLSLVILSNGAFAQSNDFGVGDRKPNITPKELRERLQVDGDVVVTSADGSRLLNQSGEFRSWKFGEKGDKIESNWDFSHRDGGLKMALKHEWTVGEDGVIRVHLQQFDSMERGDLTFKDVKYGKKLRDEEIVVKDFAPVILVVASNDKQRVVARFNLSLQSYREAKGPSDTPIVIENGILTDNKSRVWAEGITVGGGKFVSVMTHLGKISMSYYPFPGATVIGTAEGGELKVKSGDLTLKLRSAKPFVVGDERLKVYGRVETKLRTHHAGSVRMNVSSDGNRLLEN